jgi:hypothetical protein
MISRDFSPTQRHKRTGKVDIPDLGMSTSNTCNLVKPNELYMMFPNVVRPLPCVSHGSKRRNRDPVKAYPFGTDDRKALTIAK